MKHWKTLLQCSLLAGVMAASLPAAPLGTAFNYQGRLDQNGQPTTNGIYGLSFVSGDLATACCAAGTVIG